MHFWHSMIKKIGFVLVMLLVLSMVLPMDASAETVTETSEKIYGYADWGGARAATFELEVKAKVRITFAYSEGLSSITLVKDGSEIVTPTSTLSGSGNYGDTYKYDKKYYYDLEPGKYAINVFAGAYENTGGTEYWLQIRATYEAHTHNYNYSTKKVAPTCTARGYTKHSCSCGDYYTDSYVDKLPHTEVYAPREVPTCTKTGKDEGTICSVCGTTISGRETIPKLPHDTAVEIPRVEPTCTMLGKEVGAKCSVCGTISIAQEDIPKLPHDTAVEIPREEPTCATLGKTTGAKCSVCGTISIAQENIPMLPHTEVSAPDVAATCTATGKADVKVCEVCGKELSYTIIPLLPHEYENNFCVHCNAEDSSVVSAYGQCGNNAKWVLTKSGTLTISGTGAMKNYSGSNAPWYSYRSSVKSIVVEDGITSIGSYAFYECRSATSVSIPETVTILGDHCLEWCTSLTKITLHAGVTSIGTGAFFGCGGIGDFLITYSGTMKEWVQKCKSSYEAQCRDGVVSQYGTCGKSAWWMVDTKGVLTIFGTGAMNAYSSDSYAPWYSYRTSIKSINIEDGITSIGPYSFYRCSNATSVSISDTVTSLGNWCFYSCDVLVSMAIPSSVTTIGESAFAYCRNLTNISIPNGVKTIQSRAFEACSSLTNVTIPSSVTTIKQYAFSNCSSLKNVTVPLSVTTIEEWAFGTGNNILITYPGMVREWVKVSKSCYTTQCNDGMAYQWGNCGENAWWTLDNKGVLTIFGDGAMNAYSSDSYAPWYSYRTSIKSINIEDGITSIGPYSFYHCSNATSVSISDTVTSLGNCCFYSCDVLVSIAIPSSVTTIGESAFAYCRKLTNISISNGVKTIQSRAFEACSSLTNVTLPSSVKTIGTSAFNTCIALENITLPSSVTSIGEYAFQDSRLKSVTIPDSITVIRKQTFCGCSSLENVTIPSSVTTIGSYAFYKCNNLKNISIPGSVRSIENYAFGALNNRVKQITFQGAAPVFGENVFKNVTATAYYHSTDPSWTSAVRQNYGGTITWKAIESCNHTAVTDPAAEPTCISTGLTEGSHCYTCGATLVKQEVIPATGHSCGYALEQTPTLTEEGTLKGICEACGDETSVTLPALSEMDYVYTVTKEPTRKETGIGTYTWKEEAYGTFRFEVVLEKLMLIGDVNSDNKVNNQDRMILTRFLAKWSDYTADMIDMVAADVNCDGKVNNQDRMILTRHLAKWSGYETLPYGK